MCYSEIIIVKLTVWIYLSECMLTDAQIVYDENYIWTRPFRHFLIKYIQMEKFLCIHCTR